MMTNDMPDTIPPKPPSSWTSTPAVKAGLILLLLGLLQIPLAAVSGLIDERQERQNEVLTEFHRTWGPGQTVLGPFLSVPYWGVPLDDKVPSDGKLRHGWVQIPTSQLAISAQLVPETRSRGLFHAIVYTASLALSGSFTVPQIDIPDVRSSLFLWNEAVLVTMASDLRGQSQDSPAEIGGQSMNQVVQSVRGSCVGDVSAPAGFTAPPAVGSTVAFRSNLVLHGTQSLHLQPSGRQTSFQVAAPWSSPGFTGATLPQERGIDHSGFHANWQIVGDADSSAWHEASTAAPCELKSAATDESLGVDLLDPVPTYLMVTRAAKYGVLFLALSLLTYFIFESVSRVRIHLAQYALLGLSVSLFALLLVSLAEPLGFATGYALATLAVMGQASLYTLSVVGSTRLAAVFAALLGGLFGFLYVVLSLETFALLSGTFALFIALSAVMLVTRRLDWSGREAMKVGSVG